MPFKYIYAHFDKLLACSRAKKNEYDDDEDEEYDEE